MKLKCKNGCVTYILFDDGLCEKCHQAELRKPSKTRTTNKPYLLKYKRGSNRDIRARRRSLEAHIDKSGKNKTMQELCDYLRKRGFDATISSTQCDMRKLGFKSIGRVGYLPEWGRDGANTMPQ
jgi:hypothetical protein